MGIDLNSLEKQLQNLIEVHLVKYLPGHSLDNQIARRLTEAIRTNLTTQELDNALPHIFVLAVHPSMIGEWQKDARLIDGLTKILRLTCSDAGIRFENAPTITISADPNMQTEEFKIFIKKEIKLAETNTMQINAADERPSGRTAFLIVGGTKVYTINQVVTTIGRRLDNNLVIDDPRVSRYHSQVRFTSGRFTIFDLNSTGGTYVNGQRISQSVLYPGDVISLAGLPIVFGQDNPPASANPTTGSTGTLSPNSANRTTAILNPRKVDNDNNYK